MVKGICCCVNGCTAQAHYNRLYSRRWPGKGTSTNDAIAKKVDLGPALQASLNLYVLRPHSGLNNAVSQPRIFSKKPLGIPQKRLLFSRFLKTHLRYML